MMDPSLSEFLLQEYIQQASVQLVSDKSIIFLKDFSPSDTLFVNTQQISFFRVSVTFNSVYTQF